MFFYIKFILSVFKFFNISLFFSYESIILLKYFYFYFTLWLSLLVYICLMVAIKVFLFVNFIVIDFPLAVNNLFVFIRIF
jgi:hypothetical protein